MSKHGLQLGDRVTLHYRLECTNRLIVDTFAEAPETFRLGSGQIEARLEMLLLGLSSGEQRHYELTPGEAFGARDEARVQRLPRAEIGTDRTLTPGDGMTFDLPNGESLNATLIEVGAEDVLVDFNHPLAGLPVRFEVRILAIEPA